MGRRTRTSTVYRDKMIADTHGRPVPGTVGTGIFAYYIAIQKRHGTALRMISILRNRSQIKQGWSGGAALEEPEISAEHAANAAVLRSDWILGNIS